MAATTVTRPHCYGCYRDLSMFDHNGLWHIGGMLLCGPRCIGNGLRRWFAPKRGMN